MRLFIAAELDEIENYFLRLQKQIPLDVNKISLAKSFHLTLKFLGEVPEDKVPMIVENLKKIKLEPFSIHTSEIGFFPDEKYIRVVWVGLQPKYIIIELQKKVDNAMSQFFRKEKDFQPHITLARVKFISDKDRFLNQIKNIKTEKMEIQVKSFKLFESNLTQNGPVYTELAVFG